MKLGNISFLILFFVNTLFAFSDDKIQSVPLINLEQLSPTFEEEKSELEKFDEIKYDYEKNEKIVNSAESTKDDKIYVNLTALDKITAKTSSIKLAIGENSFFGPLEIKALKCQLSQTESSMDTVAYIQVKDLSNKENDQVFVFNGWTFASSPTLQSIDHPIYDLWITSCENI
tara:strand:- start:476 stop:994 length:519 start_codon:yes stop_codon:yes gene_type:complete